MTEPRLILPLLLLALLPAGCGSSYAPDTYATRAVQQANRVEQGRVIGRRAVKISAEGSTGAATGAAAGGVLGATTPGGGVLSALGGVGGALVGGLVGTASEHVTIDAPAWEYVVRTGGGDLLSVTQRDRVPLALDQRVLVITGTQARIVADYTSEPARGPGPAPAPAPAAPAALASPPPAPVASPAPSLAVPSQGAQPQTIPGPAGAESAPASGTPPSPPGT